MVFLYMFGIWHLWCCLSYIDVWDFAVSSNLTFLWFSISKVSFYISFMSLCFYDRVIFYFLLRSCVIVTVSFPSFIYPSEIDIDGNWTISNIMILCYCYCFLPFTYSIHLELAFLKNISLLIISDIFFLINPFHYAMCTVWVYTRTYYNHNTFKISLFDTKFDYDGTVTWTWWM